MIELTGNENPADIRARRSTSATRPTGEDMVLTRAALGRILERYIRGEISTIDLVDLANLLEAADDVAYEAGAESCIADVLFAIATPEINGELTIEQGRTLIERLAGENPPSTRS